MPVQANGRAASSTDPETWSDYKTVRAASERIGFVLGAEVDGKRVVCVDLDHAISPDGVLTVGAADLLSRFPATWIEVSPGGDGLHVWGLLDGGHSRCVFEHQGQSVEIYVDRRYITITSSPFSNAPLALADVTEVLHGIV